MLTSRLKSLLKREDIITPLNIAIAVYVLSVLILKPWGNFPISDDFFYLTQVKAFSMGVFIKSALIDPTFILQAFIGLIWGKVFGITYVSLRVLTVIFSILCIVGVDKILSFFNVRKSIKTLSLVLVAFIPQFYACSLTFMSENYFLSFILFSLYNFLLFTKTNKNKYLLIASILGGLSMMIRQYGVVLFITYLSVYIMTSLSSKLRKLDIKKILTISIPFIILGGLGIFWPKYFNFEHTKSEDFSAYLASFEDIVSRILSINLIPYIGYLLLPFTIPAFIKVKKKIVIPILLVSIFLSFFIYKNNVFSIGNLFYLEGLHARLVPTIRENLFNNVPFKMFISYLVSLSFITLVYYLVRELIKFYRSLDVKKVVRLIPNLENSSYLLLFISLIGFYLIVMITDRVFDRYLLNFFVILVILVSIYADKYKFNPGKLSFLMILLISIITFFLVFDYYRLNKLKWNLADRLSTEIGVDRYKIFIDNVYARTVYMEQTENYKGLLTPNPEDYHPYCFVQEYTSQNKNILNDFISTITKKGLFGKQIYNPQVENAGKLKELLNRFDPTDTLFFDEKYPSPMYNLIGRDTFVRAFCTQNYKELR